MPQIKVIKNLTGTAEDGEWIVNQSPQTFLDNSQPKNPVGFQIGKSGLFAYKGSKIFAGIPLSELRALLESQVPEFKVKEESKEK